MRVNLPALALSRVMDDKYFPLASEIVGVVCVVHATQNLGIRAYQNIWAKRNEMNCDYYERDRIPPIHESVETLKRGFTHLLPSCAVFSVAVIGSLWLLSWGEKSP